MAAIWAQPPNATWDQHFINGHTFLEGRKHSLIHLFRHWWWLHCQTPAPTTRRNVGFCVLPKDSLTHEQELNLQSSDHRSTALPLLWPNICWKDAVNVFITWTALTGPFCRVWWRLKNEKSVTLTYPCVLLLGFPKNVHEHFLWRGLTRGLDTGLSLFLAADRPYSPVRGVVTKDLPKQTIWDWNLNLFQIFISKLESNYPPNLSISLLLILLQRWL